ACTRRWATSVRCSSSGTGTLPRTNGWHNLTQLRDPKFAGNVNSGSNFNASTGVFTAPNAGYYLVSGEIMFNVSSGAVNNQFQALVIANGVTVFNPIFIVQATTTPLALLPFSVLVSLAAGQTLSVQALQTNTSAQTLNVGANANVLSIVQIP
ncbi:hypothetical protein, partial [Caballeronia sp. M23-90]